jgi:hypothetical protein
MKPTLSFRHVWRTINDGNEDVKVLMLQQWHQVEGWEHIAWLDPRGEWKDVEISTQEPKDNKGYTE